MVCYDFLLFFFKKFALKTSTQKQAIQYFFYCYSISQTVSSPSSLLPIAILPLRACTVNKWWFYFNFKPWKHIKYKLYTRCCRSWLLFKNQSKITTTSQRSENLKFFFSDLNSKKKRKKTIKLEKKETFACLWLYSLVFSGYFFLLSHLGQRWYESGMKLR